MGTPLPDHLPQVLLGDLQLEDVRVGANGLVDVYRLRTVDEHLHNHIQQLFHS